MTIATLRHFVARHSLLCCYPHSVDVILLLAFQNCVRTVSFEPQGICLKSSKSKQLETRSPNPEGGETKTTPQEARWKRRSFAASVLI